MSTERSPGATQVVLSLYAGAYGRTLRIDLQRTEDLARLRAAVTLLAEARATAVELCEWLDAAQDGLVSCYLVLAQTFSRRSAVNLWPSPSGEPAVEWRLPAAGWAEIAHWLTGLSHGAPGHQYLSDEGVDDVLVEVACFEPRPAGLAQT